MHQHEPGALESPFQAQSVAPVCVDSCAASSLARMVVSVAEESPNSVTKTAERMACASASAV